MILLYKCDRIWVAYTLFDFTSIYLPYIALEYIKKEDAWCHPFIKTNWKNLGEAKTGCNSIASCARFHISSSGIIYYCSGIDATIVNSYLPNTLYTKNGK